MEPRGEDIVAADNVNTSLGHSTRRGNDQREGMQTSLEALLSGRDTPRAYERSPR